MATGVGDDLSHLSVGLEHLDDLVEDLDQVLPSGRHGSSIRTCQEDREPPMTTNR